MGSYVHRMFFLICVIGALAILGSTLSKTPVLPLFSAHLGASAQEIGWIVIASTIPGILISFPAGAIADTLGNRRVMMASLIVFATAPLLYLVISMSLELMAVRFYHGFATAIFGTVAAAAIAAHYPQQRAAMMSTYSSATTVGRSVAPFLGGFLISSVSFRSVYVACAVSGAAALAIGVMLPADAQSPVQQKRALPRFLPALREALASRGIILTSLVEAAQFLVFGAVEAFLALYAASVGVPAWQIGIILGVQLLSVIAIKPMRGTLSDRYGRFKIIAPGLALEIVSVGMLPAGNEVIVLSLLSLVYGIGFAMMTSSTSALVADFSAQGMFGASIGVLRTIMDIGQTIGPLLAGFVIGSWGYPVAFPVLAVILLASCVVVMRIPRGE